MAREVMSVGGAVAKGAPDFEAGKKHSSHLSERIPPPPPRLHPPIPLDWAELELGQDELTVFSEALPAATRFSSSNRLSETPPPPADLLPPPPPRRDEVTRQKTEPSTQTQLSEETLPENTKALVAGIEKGHLNLNPIAGFKSGRLKQAFPPTSPTTATQKTKTQRKIYVDVVSILRVSLYSYVFFPTHIFSLTVLQLSRLAR